MWGFNLSNGELGWLLFFVIGIPVTIVLSIGIFIGWCIWA